MNYRSNMKFLLTLMFFVGITVQTSYSQAGGSAVPFLLISPDARASGMGEVGTAIADDINAIYWNPAGLGFHDYVVQTGDREEEIQTPYRQISLTYSKWLPQFNTDLFYSYATYGQYVKEIDGALAFNFTYMHLGEFQQTFEDGKLGKKFISNEYSFGVSYATIIATDLAVGAQLRYIQSRLAPVSVYNSGDAGIGTSASFDLGMLWKPTSLPHAKGGQNKWFYERGDWASIGFNLQNVGPKMTYRQESDPLPTTLRLGLAWYLLKDEFNDLKVACDVSKLLVKRDSLGSDPLPKSLITGWENPGVELAFGLEYWYAQIVALRAGYFTEPARLGSRRFWNFGAGVRYDMFHLDFSFINTTEENHPLANTMRFSIIIDWN